MIVDEVKLEPCPFCGGEAKTESGVDVIPAYDENGYLPFAKWAFKNGYSWGLSLDRIDVDGCYSPSNCRWATDKEQQNNKRSNRIIEYDGEKYTLTQLAEKFGIRKTTLKERLNMGWSVEDAVNRPVRKRTKGWRPSDMREAPDA